MATLATTIRMARTLSGANTQSMADQAAIDFANDGLINSRKEFIRLGVDVGQTQEVYFTPSATVGVYNYPPGTNPPQFLALKAMWANFNDTTQQDYVPVTKYDPSNLPQGASLDFLRVNQPPQQPMYNDHGSNFEIIPTPIASFPNLTNAIKLLYFIMPTLYATTGDTIVYPESMDTNILAYWMAACQLKTQFKFTEAASFETEFLVRVKKVIAMMGQGGQSTIVPQQIPLDGTEF